MSPGHGLLSPPVWYLTDWQCAWDKGVARIAWEVRGAPPAISSPVCVHFLFFAAEVAHHRPLEGAGRESTPEVATLSSRQPAFDLETKGLSGTFHWEVCAVLCGWVCFIDIMCKKQNDGCDVSFKHAFQNEFAPPATLVDGSFDPGPSAMLFGQICCVWPGGAKFFVHFLAFLCNVIWTCNAGEVHFYLWVLPHHIAASSKKHVFLPFVRPIDNQHDDHQERFTQKPKRDSLCGHCTPNLPRLFSRSRSVVCLRPCHERRSSSLPSPWGGSS